MLVAATLGLGAEPPATTPLGLFPLRGAWDLPLASVLTTAPALVGERGYFPIDGGRLAAYDLRSGSLQWVADASPISEPASGAGLLFLAEADALTALDENTGVVRWRLAFTEPLAVPLVWDNGWLIASATSGSLLAFRASDGHLVWRRDLEAPVTSVPSLAADRVYVSTRDGHVLALQIETGTPIWNRRVGGTPGDLVALDDRIYVGSTDNYLYCLLARDGTIDWRWMAGGDIVGRPVVVGNRVFFASLDNVLRGLDRKSGVQKWKRGLEVRPAQGPVPAGDVLILSGVGTTLPAFSMATGAPAGEIAAGALLYTAPHAFDMTGLPMVTLVAHDIAQGTIVKSLVRSTEPNVAPVAPLPNPVIPAAPVTSSTPATTP